MCESCKKFNNITIVSRWELQLVADEMKRSIEKNELIEEEQLPLNQVTTTSVFKISEGEPVGDTIKINLRCTKCDTAVEVRCDMYHGRGGVEVVSES